MTLQECFNANKGKALLIPGGGAGNEGQCVQWADTVLHDVYQLPYHYGNAIDWWRDPKELLDHFDKVVDGTVKQGDFVIFNEWVGSVYGHIDVAMEDGTTDSFLGADSNWDGNKTVHLVQHIGRKYVQGILRMKGADMFEGRSAADWAAQAKDAEQYKQGVVKSVSWKKGMDQNPVNITTVIDSLEQFKADTLAHPAGYTPVSEQLYRKES